MLSKQRTCGYWIFVVQFEIFNTCIITINVCSVTYEAKIFKLYGDHGQDEKVISINFKQFPKCENAYSMKHYLYVHAKYKNMCKWRTLFTFWYKLTHARFRDKQTEQDPARISTQYHITCLINTCENYGKHIRFYTK